MALFAKSRIFKITFGVVIMLVIVSFCVLKRKPPIAIVQVNSNTTFEILSVQRDTLQDVFVGNPVQYCCHFVLEGALQSKTRFPRWLTGHQMARRTEQGVTWFITRTRFANEVATSNNPVNKIQINLVWDGAKLADVWGEPKDGWVKAHDGFTKEMYTIWKLPAVKKETINLEIFDPRDRDHGKEITIPNVVMAY